MKNLDGERLSSIESDNQNEDDYVSDKEIKTDDEVDEYEEEQKQLIKEMNQLSPDSQRANDN